MFVKMVVKCVWYHVNALKCFYKNASKNNIIFFFYKRQYEVDIVCVYKKWIQRSNGWKPKPILEADKSIILWCEHNNYYTVTLMVEMFFYLLKTNIHCYIS